MSKFKKISGIIGTILLVVLIAIVIVMFDARLSGEAPSIFGYQIYRVSSESMEPELIVGDVILVKDVPAGEIEKGDIVTYKGEKGTFDGKLITHKVIEDPEYKNGKYVFQTAGIYDGALPDPEWDEDQLLGKYMKKLPVVDKIYNFFVTPYGLITFILVIMVLFGYEMIALVLSYKDEEELLKLEESEDDESEDGKESENEE